MNKILLLTTLLIVQLVSAQVGIGTTSPRGALEIFSNNKGVLPPRVALTSLNTSSPIINPQGGNLADGTLIYNTANTSSFSPGFYYWENNRWVNVTSSSNSWSLRGNSNINENNDFLGTSDNSDLVVKTNNIERLRIKSNGNIGIGTSNPTAKVEINSETPNVSGLKFSNVNSTSPTSIGQPLGVDNAGNVIVTNNTSVYTFNNGSINLSGFFNVNDLDYSTATNSDRTINITSSTKTAFINYMIGFDLVGTPATGSGSAYYEIRLFIDGLATNNYVILQEIGSGTSMSATISAIENLSIGSHLLEIKLKRVQNIGTWSGANQQFRPISVSFNVAYIQ